MGKQARAGASRQTDGRARIMAAALEVFSTSGFEGSSLRQIADRAGVQHQLVVYHFKTKDALWRAVAASFFADGTVNGLIEQVAGQPPAEALRTLVRTFVLFTARRPEYHRIATFEGQSDNERLRWLLSEYVRPYYETSTRLIREAQEVGAVRSGVPGQLHYAVIGIVTTSFAFAAEYSLMTGIEPFAPAQIESVIDLACSFLGLPPSPGGTGQSISASAGKG